MRRITTARQLGVLDPWSTTHSCITLHIFTPTPLRTPYFKKGSTIPVRHPPPLTLYSARGWIQKGRMVITDNTYRSQEALRWPSTSKMIIARRFSLTNFFIATTALGFQVFVLYPWHKQLDDDFKELREESLRILKRRDEAHLAELLEIKELIRRSDARSTSLWRSMFRGWFEVRVAVRAQGVTRSRIRKNVMSW